MIKIGTQILLVAALVVIFILILVTASVVTEQLAQARSDTEPVSPRPSAKVSVNIIDPATINTSNESEST